MKWQKQHCSAQFNKAFPPERLTGMTLLSQWRVQYLHDGQRASRMDEGSQADDSLGDYLKLGAEIGAIRWTLRLKEGEFEELTRQSDFGARLKDAKTKADIVVAAST